MRYCGSVNYKQRSNVARLKSIALDKENFGGVYIPLVQLSRVGTNYFNIMKSRTTWINGNFLVLKKILRTERIRLLS